MQWQKIPSRVVIKLCECPPPPPLVTGYAAAAAAAHEGLVEENANKEKIFLCVCDSGSVFLLQNVKGVLRIKTRMAKSVGQNVLLSVLSKTKCFHKAVKCVF